MVAAVLVAVAALLLIDPFSSGIFSLNGRIDITTSARPFASPARLRDLHFDGAIFGTSTSILIDPAPIGDAIGHKFVLLSIEGALPRVQLYLMDRFAKLRRPGPVILVAVLDHLWCPSEIREGGALLPLWLYEGPSFEYIWKILSPESIRAAGHRIGIWLGWTGDKIRRDGYQGLPYIEVAERKAAMLRMPQPADDVGADAPFPLLDLLNENVRALSPDSIVLFVFPPVYVTTLPLPGSAADARFAACKARVRTIAQSLPRADVLDMRVPGDLANDPSHFVDPNHYDLSVAGEIGRRITDRLQALLREKPP